MHCAACEGDRKGNSTSLSPKIGTKCSNSSNADGCAVETAQVNVCFRSHVLALPAASIVPQVHRQQESHILPQNPDKNTYKPEQSRPNPHLILPTIQSTSGAQSCYCLNYSSQQPPQENPTIHLTNNFTEWHHSPPPPSNKRLPGSGSRPTAPPAARSSLPCSPPKFHET
jgi:hypothetical protein